MVSAVVAAGGSGVRFGGDKTFAEVRGRPLVYWSLDRIARVPGVEEIVVVVPPDRLELVMRVHGEAMARLGVDRIVPGGERRQDSVRIGMAASRVTADLILVHDAVRPLFNPAAASVAIERARTYGAAILATPVRDTLKREGNELRVAETVPREGMWHAETPQVVRREVLEMAYAKADADGFEATDEASLVENAGGTVAIVRGGPWNVKVTEQADLDVVAALLAKEETC